MGQVYLNEKEIVAMLVVLDKHISEYPDSLLTEFLAKVPARLRKVWELQHGKKNTETTHE